MYLVLNAYLDIFRATVSFRGKECKTAKLFAKHMKVSGIMVAKIITCEYLEIYLVYTLQNRLRITNS